MFQAKEKNLVVLMLSRVDDLALKKYNKMF